MTGNYGAKVTSPLAGVTVTFESATTVRVKNDSSMELLVLYKPASDALSNSSMNSTVVKGSSSILFNGSTNLAYLGASSECLLTYPAEINIIGIYPADTSYPGEWIQAVGQSKYASADEFFNTSDNVYVYERPPAEPLSTPTGLYADQITSDSATTHWTGDANASNFKVQYKAAGDTVWTETFTD